MKRLFHRNRLTPFNFTRPYVEGLEQRQMLTNVVDFALEDVNPTSQTAGQLVSPFDYAGQTSAWFFGEAT